MTLQDVKKKIPAIQRLLNGGQKKIVVIDGPSGPTGKTTAARLLADAGIPVYEEYQVIRITMDEPVQLDLRDADTEALVQELCRRGALRVNTLDRAPYQILDEVSGKEFAALCRTHEGFTVLGVHDNNARPCAPHLYIEGA